ncbi:MAG: hypothetical protein WCX46_03595 [Candidatus Paceibacterota bacterium]
MSSKKKRKKILNFHLKNGRTLKGHSSKKMSFKSSIREKDQEIINGESCEFSYISEIKYPIYKCFDIQQKKCRFPEEYVAFSDCGDCEYHRSEINKSSIRKHSIVFF